MTRAKKNDVTRIVGSVGSFASVSPVTSFFKTGFSLVIQDLARREETEAGELIVALANPQTGETIQIAARTVPTFKAGKGLKGRVKV